MGQFQTARPRPLRSVDRTRGGSAFGIRDTCRNGIPGCRRILVSSSSRETGTCGTCARERAVSTGRRINWSGRGRFSP